jgi:hypothetical protein
MNRINKKERPGLTGAGDHRCEIGHGAQDVGRFTNRDENRLLGDRSV